MQSVINILFHSQIRQQNELHTAFHVNYKGSKAGNRRTDLNTKALSKHPPLDEVHYKHMWEIIRVSLKKQFAPTRSSRAAQIFTPPLFSVNINKSLGLAPGIDAWQQMWETNTRRKLLLSCAAFISRLDAEGGQLPVKKKN